MNVQCRDESTRKYAIHDRLIDCAKHLCAMLVFAFLPFLALRVVLSHGWLRGAFLGLFHRFFEMEQQCDAIFEEVLGEDEAGLLDFPIRKYLVNILDAQTSLDTSSSETNVIETIGMFLDNCGCRKGMDAAREVVREILAKMKGMNMIPEVEQESTTRLLTPIQV